MFRYVMPEFQAKRLLRAEMLEQLRDYPKNFLELYFQGYSGGIVCGCQIAWYHGRVEIASGIIYHAGKLYFMEKPYQVDCPAEDRVRYLKVQFLEEVHKEGKVESNTRIILDGVKPDSVYEMELCRFRLQEGAELRSSYRNFEDYATEYDTVNRIHVPFAAYGQPMIWPEILMQFAKEMLESGGSNIYDINFSMSIMANNGNIPQKYLAAYLQVRLEEKAVRDGNQNLYEGLNTILKLCKTGKSSQETCSDKTRSVILL